MPKKEKKRDTAATLHLFNRCYTDGKEKRAADLEHSHPFKTTGSIENPWREQWGLIPNLASWKSKPYVNFCFRAVKSYSTFLTDNRPAIDIGPVEESDRPRSEIIKAGVNRWWDLASADTKVFFGVQDSRIYGVGWWHLKRMDMGVINPSHVIVDPDCTCEDFDPTWLVYEYKAQVGAVKKKYKDNKDVDWDNFDTGWEAGYDPEHGNEIDTRFRDENERLNPALSCNVYEFWTKDDSEVVWSEDADKFTITKSKKKYKNGRVMVLAGGQVLEDRANPYDHGEFPFIPIFAYPTTGRFYPAGDIENIIGLQTMYNRMMQLLYDQTVQAGGFLALVNPSLGVKKEQMTNAPAYALECRDVNRAVNILRTPQPSRHVFEFLATIEKAINDILGLHDISYGAYTPGNKTAEEVATIAQSDLTRVRSAARLLEWSMRKLGRQLLHNMKQYSKETWIVEVAGNYDNTQANTAEFTPGELITKDVLERDIKISPDSMLPTTQQETAQQAFQLFGMGVIDGEELLRRLRWPNFKEVWSRAPGNPEGAAAQQAQAQQAQAQQAQAQAPEQPAPAPVPAEMAGGGAPVAGMATQMPQADPLEELMAMIAQGGPEVLQQLPPELIDMLVPLLEGGGTGAV